MLLIDLGNTRVKLRTVLPGAGPSEPVRVATHPVDGLESRLALALRGAGPGEGEAFGVSVRDAAIPAVEAALGRRAAWAGRELALPVPLRVAAPGEVGPDRVLGACAAWRRAGGAAICIGFGTAVTVDLAAEDGAFLGGVIMPGVRLWSESLHARTARLPLVEPRPPALCPAGRTREAISSGILLGLAGAVERVVAELKRSAPSAVRVFATGGDAPLIAPLVAAVDETAPDLVLEGLEYAARLGRG